jgi:GDP-L-fucose synthase
LAETIKRIVGYTGTITWDASKPDGTPRKLMDVSKMNEMGWKAQVDLEIGIQKTYEWYLNNQKTVQQRSN